MINYKCTISYDGTGYSGFQRQDNSKTIQEQLEKAVSTIHREKITVTGAGRTDAGVHAKGQVINYKSNLKIPIERLPYAINSLLPNDIVVYEAEIVPDEFNARRDALKKTYCYYAYISKFIDPFRRNHALHIQSNAGLDINEMKKAANYLIGRHDFASFKASGNPMKSTVRHIYNLDITRADSMLKFEVTGNGFLYKMVRIIVGTLLQVGRGKIAAYSIPEIIEKKDRYYAGPTAKAHGLFLEQVYYS